MAEANTGKGSRTERVLAPEFVQELESLTVEEVHVRRDEAFAEREFQSYLRRLVQVRQDILGAERDRRASGESRAPLVERLTSVLSEGPPRGPGRGEALSLAPSAEDMAEAERIADAATGGPLVSELDTLDDAALDQALEALAEKERSISVDRVAVLRVHDRLQEELKRRYREDPSVIPTEV